MATEEDQAKKQWLNRYKLIGEEIKRLEEEKQRWFEIATKRNQVITGMPHGNNGENKSQIALDKIWEIEVEIDKKIDQQINARKEIERAIVSIPDEVQRIIMLHHYIDAMTFQETAEEMHYSERHVLRLYKDALHNIRFS